MDGFPFVKFFEDSSLESGDCQVKVDLDYWMEGFLLEVRKVEEELKGHDWFNLTRAFLFYGAGIRGLRTLDKIGTVRKVTGLVIEAEGPEVSIGQVCSIHSERR